MSYSDEPYVISEKKRSPKVIIAIGLLVLLLATLAAVALYPRFIDFQRRNAAIGPNGGTLHFISLEGERYSLEFARSEALDFYLTIFLRPVRDATEWTPENYSIRYSPVGVMDEWEDLEWDAELNAFGPSQYQYHPLSEFRVELEILREGEVLWRGRRWSFRQGHGHGH